MRLISKPIRKKDAMQLVTGKPVYTNDLAPQNCLIVKLLRSPHANAIVESINTAIAKKVPGIEAIYTWEDIDQNAPRYTNAGQTYPEPSAHDRLIIDRHVRFVGDVVAIVAGENEKAVDKALSLIKVKYEVLEPVLDFHKALDNPILVHPEDNWEALVPYFQADNKRNLVSHEECGDGDLAKAFAESEEIIEKVYHTKSCVQQMMEPFRTFCEIDTYGRLHVTSSTQVVFHCRRIIANALHISKSKVRVTKPRIGGGFGAKQTSISEVYPAFVTWMTKKPSKILFSRYETTIAGSPRHEMELHVKLGAMKDGTIKAIELYTLSNTGAYAEHGPTTVGLTGHKSIPLYNSEAFRFTSDVVYTNVQHAGAYRGYGAPQGIFAVESAVNELAAKLNMDPYELRMKNLCREGQLMPAYYGAMNTSSTLDKCLTRVKEMSNWDPDKLVVDLGNGKVRAKGMAVAMQGSSITAMDVGGATLKLVDDGTYTLLIGAADMGTGCDTILSQIACEVLDCEMDDISVHGADTDTSPYDSGSYASSTTYATGKAVEICAQNLRQKIMRLGAELLQVEPEKVDFDGKFVYCTEPGREQEKVSLSRIAYASQDGHSFALEDTVQRTTEASPPPYMAAVVDLEIDLETGEAQVVDYWGCVDCGTIINENLARVQTEGGVLQGIGMALYENVTYSPKGRIYENSLMQYKIPSRMDIGHMHIDFIPSYEESGPFGAKSIGELVIDTPCPAIAHAIYNATGHFFTEVPILPEHIALLKQ